MKGLRQDDLLSPLLFILTTNALQSMFQKLQESLVQLPTTSTTLLQFADDTVIITPAHTHNIKLTMATLHAFGAISGLKINLQKSEFFPIALPSALNTTIAS
jgi:Reverse transcriptase (RNA-dependent DNA polymerase)